jgi:hypothetical protein
LLQAPTHTAGQEQGRGTTTRKRHT